MARFRRRFTRRSYPQRKKIWVRDAVEQVSPVPSSHFRRDILADFRTQAGLSINLPGFTLGPFKIRIGIRFDITAATPNLTQADGYLVGLVVDQVDATATLAPLPASVPNADWAWYQWYPLAPTDDVIVEAANAATNVQVVKTIEIDCKSMRKIEEVGQTMWLVVEGTGNAVIDEFTSYVQTLARLP